MPVRKLKSMAQELRVSLTIGTIELWWSKAILRMSVLWANNREAWPSTALENALGFMSTISLSLWRFFKSNFTCTTYSVLHTNPFSAEGRIMQLLYEGNKMMNYIPASGGVVGILDVSAKTLTFEAALVIDAKLRTSPRNIALINI